MREFMQRIPKWARIIIGIFLYSWIVDAWKEKSSLAYVFGVLLAAWIALCVANKLPKKVQKQPFFRTDSADPSLMQPMPTRAPQPEEKEDYTFVLTDNTDDDTQKLLHDWGIIRKKNGVHGYFEMQSNDGDVTFSYEGHFIGKPQPADREFLLANSDKIEFKNMHIRGGFADKMGEIVPFKVKVCAKVPSGLNPPKEKEFWIPRLTYDTSYVCADDVVYVDSAGKIHRWDCQDRCHVNIDRCTPMYYAEAIYQDYTECPNFYSDLDI